MADKETRVTEKTRIDYTELIRDLNGFDDVFFNVLLQGNPDTRQFLKNIYGKSIRMDCLLCGMIA